MSYSIFDTFNNRPVIVEIYSINHKEKIEELVSILRNKFPINVIIKSGDGKEKKLPSEYDGFKVLCYGRSKKEASELAECVVSVVDLKSTIGANVYEWSYSYSCTTNSYFVSIVSCTL